MKRILKYLRYELVVLIETLVDVVFLLPRFRFFNFIKSQTLKVFSNTRIGKRVVYYPGVSIHPGRNLFIGDDVDFAYGVILTTSGGVSIGDRTLIGYRTQILSSNHVIPDSTDPIFSAGHSRKSVRIANDVWIGANCVILPGVKIGEGCVVAAGSVVTKDLQSWGIYAGVPAKLIKLRFNSTGER